MVADNALYLALYVASPHVFFFISIYDLTSHTACLATPLVHRNSSPLGTPALLIHQLSPRNVSPSAPFKCWFMPFYLEKKTLYTCTIKIATTFYTALPNTGV